MTEKITQSFVLTPAEIALIGEKTRVMGDASASAALRSIIREWAVLMEKDIPQPAQPQPAQA